MYEEDEEEAEEAVGLGNPTTRILTDDYAPQILLQKAGWWAADLWWPQSLLWEASLSTSDVTSWPAFYYIPCSFTSLPFVLALRSWVAFSSCPFSYHSRGQALQEHACSPSLSEMLNFCLQIVTRRLHATRLGGGRVIYMQLCHSQKATRKPTQHRLNWIHPGLGA